jgi:hypothetical protein
MLATPRLQDLVTLLDSWFAKPGRFGFCQGNLGIGAERAELAAYAFGASGAGVKYRYTVDPSVPDAQIT